MEIQILDFYADERGTRKGLIDVKISYPNGKWEIYRSINYFEKENKKWVSFPQVKRLEKWIPIYEREPSNKKLLDDILKAFEVYLGN